MAGGAEGGLTPLNVLYKLQAPHGGTIASNQYTLGLHKMVPNCTTNANANKSKDAPPTRALPFFLDVVLLLGLVASSKIPMYE